MKRVLAAAGLWLGLAVSMGLAPVMAHAQLHVDTISAKRSDLKTEFEFPVVAGGDATAVRRINTWLQISELQKLPGQYKKSPFEDIWPPAGKFQGVTSLAYSVAANMPGYLSLVVSGEFMGPYPSQGKATFNFDARTGDVLRAADIFTQAGVEQLRQMVGKARAKRIDDFLAALPKAKSAKVSDDDLDTAEQQRALYTECRGTIQDDEISEDELTLDKNKLTLTSGACAPHANQDIDDLGDFDNTYAYADLAKLLSDYGRCLLVAQRTDCSNTQRDPSHGLYWGTLGGRSPITLAFGTHNAADGYFYDKYGKFIPLGNIEQKDNIYHLTEQLGGQNAAEALFELTPQSDGGLKGTWTRQDTGETLPVVLHR